MNVLEGILIVSKAYEKLSEEAREVIEQAMNDTLPKLGEGEKISLFALADADAWFELCYNNIGESVEDIEVATVRIGAFVAWAIEGRE